MKCCCFVSWLYQIVFFFFNPPAKKEKTNFARILILMTMMFFVRTSQCRSEGNENENEWHWDYYIHNQNAQKHDNILSSYGICIQYAVIGKQILQLCTIWKLAHSRFSGFSCVSKGWLRQSMRFCQFICQTKFRKKKPKHISWLQLLSLIGELRCGLCISIGLCVWAKDGSAILSR